MNVIQQITDLYHSQGNTHYGENVSQLEHALQTAQLAINDQKSEDFVAACFLHDIGHLQYAEGLASRNIDGEHEELGANWLSDFFPESVTEPIRLHVAAKRYLCVTDQNYYDTLSKASKHSLKLQGGPFSEQEMIEFEKNDFFREAVQLRIYDDCGKVKNLSVISLKQMVPILERQVSI